MYVTLTREDHLVCEAKIGKHHLIVVFEELGSSYVTLWGGENLDRQSNEYTLMWKGNFGKAMQEFTEILGDLQADYLADELKMESDERGKVLA